MKTSAQPVFRGRYSSTKPQPTAGLWHARFLEEKGHVLIEFLYTEQVTSVSPSTVPILYN